ncbi:hypothetical protein OBP_116 [Pseudomonas phage OBP]|uniref:hypothetical protein n=1 Tax=Pseudomonas phage OBP TaxID=1124849 RepID=UPI000240D4A2|nr:hypothetical protein OBP_116 [Pseudomonas phage OBP]AEV89553.1 hypothetical protein OBP_116 [Pseudomonas phage OBP]
MTLNENNIDNEFQVVQFHLDGCEALNNAINSNATLAGNESYLHLHLDALSYSGMEAGNKYIDSLKEAGKRLYKEVTDMLKRIREYFSGEGKDAADARLNEAKETSDALGKMTPTAPLPDDHPARNPDTYIKDLEGGVDFNELIEEDSKLRGAMEKVRRAFEPVKNAATVGQLRAVYAQAIKASEDAINVISRSLDEKVRKAEAAASKLRNPKTPKDTDPKEVSDAVKQENQEATNTAKIETRQARIVGGMRNKIVAALGHIQSSGRGLKAKMPKSKFKG